MPELFDNARLESAHQKAEELRRTHESRGLVYAIVHPLDNRELAESATGLALELASDDLARNTEFEKYQAANIAELDKIKQTLTAAHKALLDLSEQLKAKNEEAILLKQTNINLAEELEGFRTTPPPLSYAERKELKTVRKDNFLLKQQVNAPVEASAVFKNMREELLALIANKDTQINFMGSKIEKLKEEAEATGKEIKVLFDNFAKQKERVAFLENEVIIPLYRGLDKFGEFTTELLEKRANDTFQAAHPGSEE